jgi:pimeloyl-ACP methyl ester carboxylesterase
MRTAMVGVSFRGWLALDYATRRPHRVRRLVVLCPAGIGRVRFETLIKAGLLNLCGEAGRRKSVDLVLGSVDAPDSPWLPPGVREWNHAVGEFAMVIFKNFKRRTGAIPRFGEDTLWRLTMPVRAIVGGRDALLHSYQTRSRLEATAPHATVRLMPGAGHLLPDQSTTILDFLRSPG